MVGQWSPVSCAENRHDRHNPPRSGTCRELPDRSLRRRWLDLFRLEDRHAAGNLLGDPLTLSLADLLPLFGDLAMPAFPTSARILPEPPTALQSALLGQRLELPALEPVRTRALNAVVIDFTGSANPFEIEESSPVYALGAGRFADELTGHTTGGSRNGDAGIEIGNRTTNVHSPNVPQADFNTNDFDLDSGIWYQNAIEPISPPLPNEAPIALSESVTVDEDSSILIDVLANDTDADGDTLRIDSWQFETMHGTAIQVEIGKFRYTPFPDYYGPDSFTYQATDGVASSSMVTVSITVNSVNDAPAAFNDGYAWGLAVDENDNFVNLPTGMGHGPGYFAGNVLENDIDWDWQDYVPPTPTSPPPGYPPPPPGYPPPSPPAGNSKDVLRPFIDTQPSVGSVVMYPNGVFYYMYPQSILNENFQPFKTSFTYFVLDNADAKSNTATVTMWIKKGNDFNPTTSPTPVEFVVGDDALEANAPGSEYRVITTHPAFGRMTNFEYNGDFSYSPRYNRKDETFNYKLILPNGTNYSFMNASLASLNAEVYDGQGASKSVREIDESGVGAFTVANRNDTDSDYIPDSSAVPFQEGYDSIVSATPIPGRNDPHEGVDELDLIRIDIKRPNVAVVGEMTLSLASQDLRAYIYDNSLADLDNSGLNYGSSLGSKLPDRITLNDASFMGPDNVPFSTITVYAALQQPSAAMRDYEFVLERGGIAERFKATAIWSELTDFRGDDPNETGSMLMNAPVNAALQKYRRSFIHSVDSKRGTEPGKMGIANPIYAYPAGTHWVTNPVEFEFTLTPQGISKIPRLGFDASRSVESRSQEKPRFEQDPLEPVYARNFEPNRDRANDDSAPKDARNLDEYQSGDKYYTVDAPGYNKPEPGMLGPNEDWVTHRMNGLEFIRVKIGINARITDLALPEDEIPLLDLQGSRMSALTAWHSWIRIEYNNVQGRFRSAGNTNEVGLGLRNLET